MLGSTTPGPGTVQIGGAVAVVARDTNNSWSREGFSWSRMGGD